MGSDLLKPALRVRARQVHQTLAYPLLRLSRERVAAPRAWDLTGFGAGKQLGLLNRKTVGITQCRQRQLAIIGVRQTRDGELALRIQGDLVEAKHPAGLLGQGERRQKKSGCSLDTPMYDFQQISIAIQTMCRAGGASVRSGWVFVFQMRLGKLITD